jgi:hypothetical protein
MFTKSAGKIVREGRLRASLARRLELETAAQVVSLARAAVCRHSFSARKQLRGAASDGAKAAAQAACAGWPAGLPGVEWDQWRGDLQDRVMRVVANMTGGRIVVSQSDVPLFMQAPMYGHN